MYYVKWLQICAVCVNCKLIYCHVQTSRWFSCYAFYTLYIFLFFFFLFLWIKVVYKVAGACSVVALFRLSSCESELGKQQTSLRGGELKPSRFTWWYTEDVLGPSLGRVSRSRSKVKVISGIFRLNSAVCVRFVFGKTSLACSLKFLKIFFVNILVWFRAVSYRRLFGVT